MSRSIEKIEARRGELRDRGLELGPSGLSKGDDTAAAAALFHFDFILGRDPDTNGEPGWDVTGLSTAAWLVEVETAAGRGRVAFAVDAGVSTLHSRD